MCDHCINCEWKVNSQNYENSPQIHNSEGYEMRSRKLKEEGGIIIFCLNYTTILNIIIYLNIVSLSSKTTF